MIETRYANWLRKIVIATVACLALMTSAAYLTARFEEHRADRLIAILSAVTPGITPQENVRQTLQHQSFHTGSSNSCALYHRANCDQFEFSNKWLVLLHLAPAKYVWVTLDYRDGIVVSKSVQFAEDPRISAVSRQLLRQDEPPSGGPDDPSRRVTVNINSTENAIAKVYDDENVSTEQRNKDWKVDLSCLSRLKACQNPRVILPGAFPQE